MRKYLGLIALLIAGLCPLLGQTIDTVYTENLGCDGMSFKLLNTSAWDDLETELTDYLNASGYVGVSLIEIGPVIELNSTGCWCLGGNPGNPEYDSLGSNCNCCGGEAVRSFIDFIVVQYSPSHCSELPIAQQQLQCTGCTDPEALNFNHIASIDDNSCIYPGALCHDGTLWDSEIEQCVGDITYPNAPCGEGTVWDPVNEECIIAIPADLNYDGCVTVADLLELLTVHGTCPPIPQWPDSVGNSSSSYLNLADIKSCVIHGNDNVWSWMFNYPMNYYVPDTCDFIFVRGPSTWETGSANQMPISSHRLILPDSSEDGKVILALCEDEGRLCPNLFQQYDGELIDVGVLPNGVGNNTYPSDRVVAFEFTNGIWGQTDLTPHQHLWGTED